MGKTNLGYNKNTTCEPGVNKNGIITSRCIPIDQTRGTKLCHVNHHKGRLEGRYFEVTSTELRWTGQEAAKPSNSK